VKSVDRCKKAANRRETVDTINNASQRELKRLVEQIERLEAEKKTLGEDIADKLKEAKSAGFEPAIIKKVLAIRRKGKVEWDNECSLVETYLGALEGTPLGDWAKGKKQLAVVA
jgi:uncharacterized protein (UPF0335 family)